MGIFCDGENYEREKTVTDREITYPKVLTMLGWQILRIWALDWFNNREATLQRIETAIVAARAKQASSCSINCPPPPIESSDNTIPVAKFITVTTAQKAETAQIEYVEAELAPVQAPSETFTQAMHKRKVLAQIRQIVSTEAPVHKEYVMRKVIAAWGITRVGSKISSYFETLFAELGYPQRIYADDIFLWLPEQDPSKHWTYRSFHTQPNYIAPEEIAVAAREVIAQQGTLPHDDLLREVAHLFGFNRLSTNVVAAIERTVCAH